CRWLLCVNHNVQLCLASPRRRPKWSAPPSVPNRGGASLFPERPKRQSARLKAVFGDCRDADDESRRDRKLCSKEAKTSKMPSHGGSPHRTARAYTPRINNDL